MTIAEAAFILRLTLPTTFNTLKATYHRLSRLEHPDCSKHPQASERFARIAQAYEVLRKDDASFEFSAARANNILCDDGEPLSGLGKGLGPTVNGVECGGCKGLGYTRMMEDARRKCPDCFINSIFEGFDGRRNGRCRKCQGRGRYVVGGIDKGICYACNGTGIFRRRCPTCDSTGHIGKEKPSYLYYRCTVCDGVGENRIYNPVLPRGLLL